MPIMPGDPAAPTTLGPPPFAPEGPDPGGELSALERLARAGVPLARIAIVPAGAEERFYRLNNLAERIRALFDDVDLDDPDEDDIEEVAPRAQALLVGHYLLDETIDEFYRAIGPLGARLQVRRAGEAGERVAAGRPALLAVKRLWQRTWSIERVLGRLRSGGPLAPDAAPVLIHAADAELPGGVALDSARLIVGAGVGVFGLSDGSVTRLTGVS
jgi:hypothetical protein